MSDTAFYTLIAFGGLLALFLIGLLIGAGWWLGAGYWQARSDRKIAASYVALYKEQAQQGDKLDATTR